MGFKISYESELLMSKTFSIAFWYTLGQHTCNLPAFLSNLLMHAPASSLLNRTTSFSRAQVCGWWPWQHTSIKPSAAVKCSAPLCLKTRRQAAGNLPKVSLMFFIITCASLFEFGVGWLSAFCINKCFHGPAYWSPVNAMWPSTMGNVQLCLANRFCNCWQQHCTLSTLANFL